MKFDNYKKTFIQEFISKMNVKCVSCKRTMRLVRVIKIKFINNGGYYWCPDCLKKNLEWLYG